MRLIRILTTTAIVSLMVPLAAHAGDKSSSRPVPVQRQFGFILKGAGDKPQAIGFYARGCLKGGEKLADNGPNWQAMRLSRNRHWGHPKLIKLVKRLAKEAKTHDGWPGLMVGDLSQPRGGPMFTGHRSHQIGLDADIWYLPMPKKRLTYQERENLSSIALAGSKDTKVGGNYTPAHLRLMKRAASYPEVARLFVHPAVKQALCDNAGEDRAWLRKVRPMWGHNYHFHIRMRCPAGYSGCKGQKAPASGDGCGSGLKYWLKRVSRKSVPSKKPPMKKKYRMKFGTIAWVPKACRQLIAIDNPPVITNPRSKFTKMDLPEKRPHNDPVATLLSRTIPE